MSTRDVMFSVNRALLCEPIWLQSLRDEHQGCDVQCEQGLAVWINLVTECEGWAPGMWCSVWTGPCCVNQSGYRVWGMSTRDVMFSVNRALLCESIWLQSLRDEHQGCGVQCEQGLAVWINLVTESEGWAPGMWCSVWTGPCCVNQSGYRVWGMSTRDVRRVMKLAPGARITKHKTHSTTAAPSWISNGAAQFLFVSNTASRASLNTQSSGFYFQNNLMNFRRNQRHIR